MQKKIIALAIAAAFSAPAFADTTVYGIVDAAVVRATADGEKSGTIAYSGGLAGSRIGVTSAEDLDNGMKAVIKLEYALDTQTGGGVGAARQEMLALAGGFGTVATGYLQTTGYDWAVMYDPTAGSLVSPLQSVTSTFLIGANAVAARAQRALAYISPALGDVTIAVNYSTDTGLAGAGLGNLTLANTATETKIAATLLSATYNSSAIPLSVGVVYAATSVPSGMNKTSDMAVGASYDLTVVKLMGTYQTSKVDNGIGTDKAMSFSVVAPVGPGAIVGTYAKNTVASTTAADNGKGMTVGWLQGLSKTTTLYATYTKISQDSASRAYSVINNALANANLTLGGSSTMLAVGLNKKF